MKLKLVLVGTALALATAVTAVALGAVNNSGVSLDKKQLVASAAVDGVEGGDPSSPTLEISSWSWGVSNSTSVGSGGGGGAGKASLGSLNITKVIDKASPRLAFLCASGQTIPTMTLVILRPGGLNLPYFQITLTDAVITSVQHSGSGGGDGNLQPTEHVTFDYRRVELKYTAVDGNSVTTRLDAGDRTG
jgi:type VI secretion system secreted protein Hcp